MWYHLITIQIHRFTATFKEIETLRVFSIQIYRHRSKAMRLKLCMWYLSTTVLKLSAVFQNVPEKGVFLD